MISLRDVEKAHAWLVPKIARLRFRHVGKLGIWPESLQLTGSFKVRGALWAFRNTESVIVTASSGNHAIACALASQLTNIPLIACVPVTLNRNKLLRIEGERVSLLCIAGNYEDCERQGRAAAEAIAARFLSACYDEDVIVGAGTVALDMLADDSWPSRVYVPAGGGSLLAGVAATMKRSGVTAEVVGVCARSAPALHDLFYGTVTEREHDLCSALAGDPPADAPTIPLVRDYVDRIVLVSNAEVVSAQAYLHALDIPAEPSGSVAVAAALREEGSGWAIVSGGNE